MTLISIVQLKSFWANYAAIKGEQNNEVWITTLCQVIAIDLNNHHPCIFSTDSVRFLELQHTCMHTHKRVAQLLVEFLKPVFFKGFDQI